MGDQGRGATFETPIIEEKLEEAPVGAQKMEKVLK